MKAIDTFSIIIDAGMAIGAILKITTNIILRMMRKVSMIGRITKVIVIMTNM